MIADMINHLIARYIKACIKESGISLSVFDSITISQAVHEISYNNYTAWHRRAKFAILCGAKIKS